MIEQPVKNKKLQRRRLAIAGVAAGLSAAIVSAGLTWAFDSNDSASDVPASQPLASAAPLFASDEFGFSAKFPENPQRADQVVKTGEQDITVTTFSAGQPETGYVVSTMSAVCTPLGKDVDARLKVSADGAVKGAAEASGSTPTVASQEPVTIAGHPGLQTDFTLAKGSEKMHVMSAIVVHGPRFYTLVANNPSEASWATFLESFKTTKDPAALPECAPLAGV